MTKLVSSIKGVEVQHRPVPGGLHIVQVMNCSECNEAEEWHNSAGGTYPMEALFKFARHKGWHPKKNGKHICPKCMENDHMTETLKPRELDKASRRKIWRRIDECYDDVNNRYVDDFTDHVIAQELSVPRKWVEDVREQDFGPSGENVEMERVATLLSRINHDLKEAIDECVAAAAKAEELQVKVDDAQTQLDQLRKAVGPHRIA